MRIVHRAGLVVALLVWCAACWAQGLTLYVAPNGSDAWSGRLASPNPEQTDGPFASLERARDEICKLKAAGPLPKQGVAVVLRGGAHERRQVFALKEQDSGTPDAPIVYCAYQGEAVHITGGRAIDGFKTVTDEETLSRLDPSARGHVMAANLPMQGVTDFGVLGMRRTQQPAAALEVFFKGRPMTLARWPNEGYAEVAGAPDGEKGGKFAYTDDRPRRWIHEDDPRGCGYWAHDWASSHVAFESIDPENKVIATRPPHSTYGYRKGRRFFAYNLLCELDQPGEWYLDRRQGVLYFWPPSPMARGSVEVSLAPDLISLANVSHVTFRGLTLDACRGTAIVIVGGDADSVVGCTIRNVGMKAVVLNKGVKHSVIGCDISDTGEGGILCIGGEKETLTPADFLVENNVITRCSRWQHTHSNAVNLYTVGCRVAHNLMYDIPHQAITFSGNENILECNEVHSIGFEAGELGAFYAGRDWTLCGNVIRCNYFHDIYNPCPQRDRAIMLDDGAAGIEMRDNLFVRVAEGISLSSINNKIENNVFVECRPAIGCWGGVVQFPRFDLEAGHNKTMWPRLVAVPLDRPPWSVRYPEMVPLREAIRNGDVVPDAVRAQIVRNIFWHTGEDIGFNRTPEPNCWIIRDNLRGEDPLFVDPAHDDYRLRPESPALKIGFKPIALEKIGPYQDDRRASWPVKHEVRRDMTRDLVYTPPPKKPRGPSPVFRVPRAAAPPVVDGTLSAQETSGAPMVLEWDHNGGKTSRTSRAWLRWDDEALYVSMENKVNPKTPLEIGDAWGKNDAVEIAVRNPAAGAAAPVLVLRGYATGRFESSGEAGAKPEDVKRAAAGVTYAARVASPDRWIAEWRVPFASLGIDPKRPGRFPFNLTVRKTADDLWLMWIATGAQSWRVDQAGLIDLAR